VHTFCLISANLALRASVAAATAFFFSSNIAEPDPAALVVLNAASPGFLYARVDDTFVFDTLACNCVPLKEDSGTVESEEESEVLVRIAADDVSSFAKSLGICPAVVFTSSSCGVLAMTDGLYLDAFNADLGACFFNAVNG
jgi:hypothetical protein